MKIYNKFFNEYLELNPETGSYIGIKKYNKYYSISISENYRYKYKNLCNKYLNILSEKKYNNNINKNDIYIKCLKFFLLDELEGLKYYGNLIPFDPNNNAVLSYLEFFLGDSYLPLKTIENYNTMIIHLKGFEEWTQVALTNMKTGIQKKIVISKLQCQKVIEQLNYIIKNKSYIPKKNIPTIIKKEYLTVIDDFFVKNILIINNFLKNEYLPYCLKEGGLFYLPNGRKYYQYLIDSYTTLNNLTAENIHMLGLSEVTRVNNEIKIIKNKLGFKGNLTKFKKHTKKNPKNYYKSRSNTLQSFKSIRDKLYKTVIPNFFNERISKPYQIKAIPKYLEKYSTSAYYEMPPYDNSQPGTFYLDTSKESNPKYESLSLSLHEGYPGHHFQLAYSIDKKIPKFMLYAMHNTAYIEGWGLYCENFIDKNDLMNEYGRLNYEMMRCVRLVVDTGIHHYGWSFNKACKYYSKYILSSKKELENEILRYIASPGQALSYKIGEIFIINLRDKYLKNNNNNIKSFHTKFLENGPLPLSLMKEFNNSKTRRSKTRRSKTRRSKTRKNNI